MIYICVCSSSLLSIGWVKICSNLAGGGSSLRASTANCFFGSTPFSTIPPNFSKLFAHLERILWNENNAIWWDDICNQNTLVPIDLEEQLQFVGLDCMGGFFRRPFPTDWQKCVIYILFDCNRSQSMGLRATPTNCFFQSTLTDSLTQGKPLLLKSAKAETTF